MPASSVPPAGRRAKPNAAANATLLTALGHRLAQASGTTIAERARPVWLGLLARTIAARTPSHSLLQVQSLSTLSATQTTGADVLPASLDVGEISAFYEFTLATLDRKSRKDAGQFFTPDDVARAMAAMGRPGVRGVPLTNSLWLDPCCGIGNLSAAVMEAQAETPAERLAFLRTRLFLNDRDRVAPELAAILLAFRADPDDTLREGPATVAALQAHTTHADLLGPSSGLVTAVRATYPNRETHPLQVIVNPPYLSGKMLDGFRTAACKDLYGYSLERLADVADMMVSVTPASFLQGGSFTTFRELVLETWQYMDVWAFDNVPGNLFKGMKHGSDNSNKANSTRAAIMAVWGARTPDAPRVTRASRFLRWVSSEREALLRLDPPVPSPRSAAVVLEHELAPSSFSTDIFPKVGHDLGPFYAHVMTQWGDAPGQAPHVLGDWLSKTPTQWELTVPNATRYFIPAIERTISRGAARTLYFPSSAIRDRAYLLINSSLCYWWWRLQDAGLSVSSSTLTSLPVPPSLWTPRTSPRALSSALAKIVEALRTSETKNLVVKQNAGRANENIKHPSSLIAKVTKALLMAPAAGLATTSPDTALSLQHVLRALAATHANNLAASGVDLTPEGSLPIPATAPDRRGPVTPAVRAARTLVPMAVPFHAPAASPRSSTQKRVRKTTTAKTRASHQLDLDLA